MEYVKLIRGGDTYKVYNSITGMCTPYDAADQLEAAIEHVLRIVIVDNVELRFGGPDSTRAFSDWLDARPDRDDLRELMGLQKL